MARFSTFTSSDGFRHPFTVVLSVPDDTTDEEVQTALDKWARDPENIEMVNNPEVRLWVKTTHRLPTLESRKAGDMSPVHRVGPVEIGVEARDDD